MKPYETLIQNLEKNNIKGYYVESKEDVVPLLEQLIQPGSIVSTGGSMSLKEAGVMEFLKSGKFHFLDRNAPNASVEEAEKMQREAFFADVFLCSSNAVTEDGVLYNVDGFANRVAAILYGPKSVIMVVGKNKIVRNLEEAVLRVKTIAAPKNCVRLDCQTYCQKTGNCISLNQEQPEMCSGCDAPRRVCCDYVVSAKQRIKDRIKVILVGEDLGY